MVLLCSFVPLSCIESCSFKFIFIWQAFCDLCAKLHGQQNGKNDQEHSNGRIQEQPDTHLQENHLEHNLKNPQELDEKVYTDLYKWWVKQSHCKKFRAL